jgi:hypothetical protein
MCRFCSYICLMRLQTKITLRNNPNEVCPFSVVTTHKTTGEIFEGDILNQTREINSYKGAGLIKRRQSDGKRERTQATLERIEQTFFNTLETARKLERIEQRETFKAERSNKQREERLAYRLNKRK